MRTTLPAALQAARVLDGPMRSRPDDGAYGSFRIHGPCGEALLIVASGGDPDDTESQGWEHVSVSTRRRVPNWTEMCFVKDLFWEFEECVVQYHPPRSEYVNNHPYVLHLWRNSRTPFPMPPSIFVGLKDRGILNKAQVRAILAERDTEGAK